MSAAQPRPRRPMNPTVRRIVDTAREEFASNGAAGVNLATIAARASVARQLIYYYFRSKGGLHLAVAQENALDVIDDLLSRDYGELAPRAALVAMIGDMFAQISQTISNGVGLHQCLEVQGARGGVRSLLRSAQPAVSAKLAAILRRGAADGGFQSGVDADLFLATAASMMYGCLLNEAVISAATDQDLRTPDALARWLDRTTRILLASIDASAPAHPYVRP